MRGCMAVPSWRHRGTNGRYHKLVAAVVVMAGANAVVPGCMVAVMVAKEVDDTEEREGAEDEARR